MNTNTQQTEQTEQPQMSDAERQAWAQVESVCSMVAGRLFKGADGEIYFSIWE